MTLLKNKLPIVAKELTVKIKNKISCICSSFLYIFLVAANCPQLIRKDIALVTTLQPLIQICGLNVAKRKFPGTVSVDRLRKAFIFDDTL